MKRRARTVRAWSWITHVVGKSSEIAMRCSIAFADAAFALRPIMAAFCRQRSAPIHRRWRNIRAKDDVELSHHTFRGDPMRKTLTAVATAATVAVAAVATPTAADAHRFGWGGPALFGGLVAGALISSALAPRYYGYPGYYSSYYGGDPYYGCWRRAWNGWRMVHYRVC
jgi:hypothetical protein